jgi:23S rRNA (adenine2503-C2)-methyltransferase
MVRKLDMPSIHDLPAIERLRRRLKVDSYRVRQLRKVFCKQQLTAEAALLELPDDCRSAFAAEVSFHALELVSRHDSRLDGATKLIFRTGQNLLIESVILRLATGRTALCVSTQVGCAARCDFCATGKMAIARNLSASEIIDQLVQANQLLVDEERSVRNLVFMGMGEPFHNEAQLDTALEVLGDGACFHFNPKRVLVSTVGIPSAMIRFAHRHPQVRLALSLHSARQDVRRQIMPIAAVYTLDDLREALEEVVAIQQHEVMIEYLLLRDLNDTVDDARALVDYLHGLSVHVNLIPYNPIAEAPHLVGTDRPRREAFSAVLKTAGLPVTTRYSLGADIAAACGQLVRQEHRLQFARPVTAR